MLHRPVIAGLYETSHSHQALGVSGGVIYSASRDLTTALAFDAGWWSVGTWFALVAAFAVTATVAARFRSEWTAGALLIAGPVGAFVLLATLKAAADPTPGCTYDCQGRLLLLGPAAGLLLGWALGLPLGLVLAYARRRREST